MGKPSGNDLREGKVTLPLLHALRTAPEAEASNAKELIARGSLTEQEIESLISFAKKHGGIEFAYAEMERLHAEALPLLLSYPDSATRDSLAGLFAFIIARNS